MSSLYERFEADLQRPAGGWTFGVSTIFAMLAVTTTAALGAWPFPTWTASVLALVLLALHIQWGAHGYYPRRIA